MLDGKLVYSNHTLEGALFGLLEKANLDAFERLTFFYGEEMTPNQVNQLVDQVREKYPDLDIEVHEGGQPYYQLIIAIE